MEAASIHRRNRPRPSSYTSKHESVCPHMYPLSVLFVEMVDWVSAWLERRRKRREGGNHDYQRRCMEIDAEGGERLHAERGGEEGRKEGTSFSTRQSLLGRPLCLKGRRRRRRREREGPFPNASMPEKEGEEEEPGKVVGEEERRKVELEEST